ncbi:MAG: hypothetical protein EA412_11745, partial [Chitinophagaceae bacterium]
MDLNKRLSVLIELLIKTGRVKNKSQLAKEYGFSPQHLNEMLKGRTKATTDFITWLSKLYLVRPEYLLSGEHPIFKEDTNDLKEESNIKSSFFDSNLMMDEVYSEDFDMEEDRKRDNFNIKRSEPQEFRSSKSGDLIRLTLENNHLRAQNELLKKQIETLEELLEMYRGS